MCMICNLSIFCIVCHHNKSNIYNVYKYKFNKIENCGRKVRHNVRWQDNTKKLCNFISIVVPYKSMVGYIDVKQQETYEKLKNRG